MTAAWPVPRPPGKPRPASPAVTRRLAGCHGRTRPEARLRAELHARGVRWRDATGRRLPGRPDLAWSGARVAVFADGCFWHGCPAHYRAPGGPNAAWWAAKRAADQAHDDAVRAQLTAAGWTVIPVWEHEPAAGAAARIAAALGRLNEGENQWRSPQATRA